MPKKKLEDRICAVANMVSKESLDHILWRLPILWCILELLKRLVGGNEEGVVSNGTIENCDEIFMFGYDGGEFSGMIGL